MIWLSPFTIIQSLSRRLACETSRSEIDLVEKFLWQLLFPRSRRTVVYRAVDTVTLCILTFAITRHNNLWHGSNSALRTWRSPAAATGGRSAGVLSSGSGCRTSSCPGSESGWPRRACSPSQLRQKTEHLLLLYKKQTVNDFYTVRKIWADLTESNDAGQQFLTES